MNILNIITIILLVCMMSSCGSDSAKENVIREGEEPPFAGTIFIAPDLILETDPTSYISITYIGQSQRTMLDRRVDRFIAYDAHLVIAAFDDGVELEIQINPEFELDAALIEAEKYSKVIGQMPFTLRRGLTDVSIHDGDAPFSGSDKNIVIHTVQGEKYIAEGILAETLIHETVHAVIDKQHERNALWVRAQQNDLGFISTYAESHPYREDLAESFVPYLAARIKTDRISEDLQQKIAQTIEHRMNYFDNLNIELYPMEASYR